MDSVSSASEFVDGGDKDKWARSHADPRRLAAALPWRLAPRQGSGGRPGRPCVARRASAGRRGDARIATPQRVFVLAFGSGGAGPAAERRRPTPADRRKK